MAEFFDYWRISLGKGVWAFGFVRSLGMNGIWGLLLTLSEKFNCGLGIFFVCWWLAKNWFPRFCCGFVGRIVSCKTKPS